MSFELYSERDVVQRFKDFSFGLSGNDPYIEPEDGADLTVVEMDKEVLEIYKNMRGNDEKRTILDKIIEFGRSEKNYDFIELRSLINL